HAYDGLILHELAHVRRRDHLVGWLELLAGCIWWWNPLYWYVRHQLRENAELACDGWVTSLLPGGRRAYGEALLNICEFMSRRSAPMPAVGINTGGRRFLERRLAMILRDQVPLRLPRLGLLALGLLATLTLPAWAQKVEERTEATRARPFTSYLSIPPAPPTALPAGAQEVLDQFNREQADIRREAEEKIAQARQRTLDHLKELQDQYTKSGQLDEAVAIRDRVREMESLTSRARQPMEDPGNLTAFRDRVGQTFLFNVVGNSEGTVWGNDVYTDDSPLAAAAVHAGVLKNGERGIVRVTILPGMQSYQGAQRNGITTQSFGPWQGSYRIEPQLHAYREPPTQPIDLMQLRDRVGQTFQYQIVGSDSGTIWGDDVYTDDSPVAVAAVHAGLLRPGQRGVVTIKILPGRENYTGSTRNGVTSQSYLNWDGSYTFVANSAPEPRSYRTREIPGGPRLY
ncbi:MAG TPA: LCCL domain-containing protein, partial [Humisphaera sp.]|nr:LCCL domain-containing protein [Humisphaera sp.]